MNQPRSITLCEVGLRDGLQNEKTLIPTEEKISMVRQLQTLLGHEMDSYILKAGRSEDLIAAHAL